MRSVQEIERLVVLMEKKHEADPSDIGRAAYVRGARLIFDWAVAQIKTLEKTEIVRCWECKHNYFETKGDKWEWCALHEHDINPQDFCSKGERGDCK